MKYLPLIFATLLFCLISLASFVTVIAGADKHDCTNKAVHHHHTNNDSNDSDDDHCTLLCVCACCGMVCVNLVLEDFNFFVGISNTSYNNYYDNYSFSFQIKRKIEA